MKNIEFLVAAYSIIWILLGIYFFRLGGKMKELESKLEQIEETIKK
ncbi:MAG: CcmD family protein [Deferribacterales bacterium]